MPSKIRSKAEARKPAKYPGYRTMSGVERRNARMHKLFDDAIARARAEGRSSPWDAPARLRGGQ